MDTPPWLSDRMEAQTLQNLFLEKTHIPCRLQAGPTGRLSLGAHQQGDHAGARRSKKFLRRVLKIASQKFLKMDYSKVSCKGFQSGKWFLEELLEGVSEGRPGKMLRRQKHAFSESMKSYTPCSRGGWGRFYWYHYLLSGVSTTQPVSMLPRSCKAVSIGHLGVILSPTNHWICEPGCLLQGVLQGLVRRVLCGLGVSSEVSLRFWGSQKDLNETSEETPRPDETPPRRPARLLQGREALETFRRSQSRPRARRARGLL